MDTSLFKIGRFVSKCILRKRQIISAEFILYGVLKISIDYMNAYTVCIGGSIYMPCKTLVRLKDLRELWTQKRAAFSV